MLEKTIENQFEQQLNSMGYVSVKFKSEDDMYENILDKLSMINKKELQGRRLLRSELFSIIKIIEQRARVDTMVEPYAQSFNRVLTRGIVITSMDPSESKKSLTLKIVSNTPSDNYWEVARQVVNNGRTAEKQFRYDVTLLLNGFPVVQVELKNINIEINEAINQINKYIDAGYSGLYRFIQLFVVSNSTHTRYGINNNEIINKEFMFMWSDENNNILDDLSSFTNSFLSPRMLFDILTQYIVPYGNGTEISTKDKMKVLRPYQIYAIKGAIKRIKVQVPPRKPGKLPSNIGNGYIFHTTGSGKTLTSFKCAQIAATRQDVKKVVFLVDRTELDTQTVGEFRSINAPNVTIDKISSTKNLLDIFKSADLDKKVVVTTIQKFSNAIAKANSGDEEYNNTFSVYKNLCVVFIIDECHRTQFGEMHSRIKNYFNNAHYIGFTGTPIREENKQSGGMTTEEIFGSVIHTYHIGNAIRDGNVLGFSIDYHRTFKENKKLQELSLEKTDSTSVDKDELYMRPERIKIIVDKIYEIHDRKTQNRKYTALFAVSSIPALIQYYNQFKATEEKLIKENRESEILKVSGIFTPSDAPLEQLDDSSRQYLDKIIQDFNQLYTKSKATSDTFRDEIVKKLRCDKGEQIDIVLVVGMLLTGFDSKMTNTLYVDKNLEYHGLLQAFSRTNRVESANKPFGNIVCFRPELGSNVKEAIELFSCGSGELIEISKDYKICLSKLEELVDEVLSIVPKDFNISSNSVSDEDKRKFIVAMRGLNRAITEIKQFSEFDWDKDIGNKLTQEQYAQLIGEQKTIHSSLHDTTNRKESILNYVDFCMELVGNDKVNYQYIHDLICNIDTSNIETLKQGCTRIMKLINESSNDTIRYKRVLIKEFLDSLVRRYRISGSTAPMTKQQIESDFRTFILNKKAEELEQIAAESKVDIQNIENILHKFEVSPSKVPDTIEGKKIDNKQVNEIVKNTAAYKSAGFKERITVKRGIISKVIDVAKKYLGI